MSSISGVAPAIWSLNQCSMHLWTVEPRTSDPPFGSGRPAPYLNHQRAEQLRNWFACEGESRLPRVSFFAAGPDTAPAAKGEGAAAGNGAGIGITDTWGELRIRPMAVVPPGRARGSLAGRSGPRRSGTHRARLRVVP